MRDYNLDGVLVGTPYQLIHEESTVQKYPIGMIYERHGKRFRYCRAAEDILQFPIRGCPNISYVSWHTGNVTNRLITAIVAAKAGEHSIICVHGAGAHALDDFQGGHITLFGINVVAAANHRSYGVIGSDVSIDTTHTRVYLDEPLPYDFKTVNNADLYQSPYRNIGSSQSVGSFTSVLCVPHTTVTAGNFFWGQTRGPCWVTPTAGIVAANTRMVTFASDGTIAAAAEPLQVAGYLLHKGDGAEDDAHIMLMLE